MKQRKRLLFFIVFSVLIIFSSCDLLLELDFNPLPGNSGIIELSEITETGVKLSWTAASDDKTATVDLEYKVYKSLSDNIGTVALAEANGYPLNAWTKNITQFDVTGLSPNTTYYFNILVKDTSQNKAAYVRVPVTTLEEAEDPDVTPPTPGNSGIINSSEITETGIKLSWAAATDDKTAQSDLEYIVYRSLTDNIGTVALVEANGTPLNAWTKNLTHYDVTGLTPNTTYYFNILVKDSSENKAAYAKVSVTTLEESTDERVNFDHLGEHRNDFIRYIYTGYNKGAGVSDINTIIGWANDSWYKNDENVLAFYRYLAGEIPLDDVKPLNFPDYDLRAPFDGEDMHFDENIQNYIIDIVESDDFQNNSHTNFLLKTYDQPIPINPEKTDKNFNSLNPSLITSYSNRTTLINRVYELIKYYNGLTGAYSFGKWFSEFHPTGYNNFLDSDIYDYSEFLVDLAYAYTNTGISTPQGLNSTSQPWKYGVGGITFENIPIEMLLATLIQESRLFPGSFRAETTGSGTSENIYAISFGLGHSLIDADFLKNSTGYAGGHDHIGNDLRDRRNFSIISRWYLGNDWNSNLEVEETYFSHWDLLSLRGSYVYTLAYLELVYLRFYEEWFETL